MTRREARELAFILLFEKMFTEDTMEQILEAARDARDVEVDAFASRLAVGASENLDALDEVITPALHNWSRERLSRVALTVLRLAVHEMQTETDNPVSVVINEAVELAKKYGGSEDASFINGVLGTLSRA